MAQGPMWKTRMSTLDVSFSLQNFLMAIFWLIGYKITNTKRCVIDRKIHIVDWKTVIYIVNILSITYDPASRTLRHSPSMRGIRVSVKLTRDHKYPDIYIRWQLRTHCARASETSPLFIYSSNKNKEFMIYASVSISTQFKYL